MLLCDVNVLLPAFMDHSGRGDEHRAWLGEALVGDEPFGVLDLVLSSVVRISTNRRVFDDPSEPAAALDFCRAVRDAPAARWVEPGPQHWTIFDRLCRETGARANLVPDAYLAALSIEQGATWITHDRGFARFPGLRWRLPLTD